VNVNGQNLSVLEDFLQLEDKDVETLCQVIRQPGGVNSAGNQNQGMQVLAMAEANLKRMCYELHHYTRVSRPVVWADITLLSVCALSAQAEMEASHQDPITLTVMDPKNDKFFRGLQGYKKCTLSYVYRPDLVPVLAAAFHRGCQPFGSGCNATHPTYIRGGDQLFLRPKTHADQI